jgi:hypothetical protein
LARLGVRGTFSQSGPSHPAASGRLTRTLGLAGQIKWHASKVSAFGGSQTATRRQSGHCSCVNFRRLVRESWQILRGTISPQTGLAASVAHRNNQLRPNQGRSISRLGRRSNHLSGSRLRGAAAGSRCRQSYSAQLLPQQQSPKLPAPVRPQSYGRGLTSRSSADPLRRATGPARPSLSIIGLAGPASRRSGRLSSNVMPHQMPFMPAVPCSRSPCRRTQDKLRFQVAAVAKSCTHRPHASAHRRTQSTEYRAAHPARFRAQSSPASNRGFGPPPTQSEQSLPQVGGSGPRGKPQVRATGVQRASHSEPLVRGLPRSGGVPPLLHRQPGRGGFRGSPRE